MTRVRAAQRRAEFLDGVHVARDHDRRRAVDRCDRQTVAEVEVGGGQGDGHHAAATREGQDRLAAQRHHGGGVGQAERARDAGGGDLALRVADDGGRFDAVGAPQLGERDHDGPQHRLHHVDPLQLAAPGACRCRSQSMCGAQRGRALGHPGGEHGGGVQQFGRHADPLGALAGEDHDGTVAQGRTANEIGRGAPGGQRLQARAQGGAVADHDSAVVEQGAGGDQRVGDVADRRVGAEQPERLARDRVGRLAGEHPGDRALLGDRLGRRLRRVRGPAPGSCGRWCR